MAARCLGCSAAGLPLVLRVVGDAVEPDLAVRPGLHARPFDAVRQVLRLAQRPDVDHAGRAAGAAAVDANADIAVRHPFLRIDHLPALILVGRAAGDVRVVLAHALPLLGIQVFEVQPFAVGPVGQDHRILAPLDRPVDIAAQHDAVVHLDRHVPVDPHAVADFADLAIAHGCVSPPPTATNFCAAGPYWDAGSPAMRRPQAIALASPYVHNIFTPWFCGRRGIDVTYDV